MFLVPENWVEREVCFAGALVLERTNPDQNLIGWHPDSPYKRADWPQAWYRVWDGYDAGRGINAYPNPPLGYSTWDRNKWDPNGAEEGTELLASVLDEHETLPSFMLPFKRDPS